MKGLTFLQPLLLLGVASSFSVSKLTSNRQNLKPLGAATNLDGKTLDTSRRDALASLLLVASAGIVGSSTSPQVSSSENLRLLGSVDEALALIESDCDRRFLHGIVASGYNLMYRGIPTNNSRFPMIIESEASDTLLSSGYISLEKDMADRPIKPSNAQLAFTSPGLVVDGEAASIWPLGNDVHFAWSEDGGSLQNSAGKVIVDGVDCGRMSLEDALEAKDREIMFRADQYLAVPASMQEDLLTGLRSAFII